MFGTPITRNELIEEMVASRMEHWDSTDTAEAIEFGRNGLAEFTNADLEEEAFDWLDEEYHITDADTSKPSAETINAELLDQLREAQGLLGYHMPDKFDDAIHEANWTAKMNAIQAAIAKAERGA